MQTELNNWPLDLSWTLFLDRDGVINKKIPHDYVKTWEEFEFLPQTLAAWPLLSARFGRVVVVTNQQGIGKRLMRSADLAAVHQQMQLAIQAHAGRLDAIYHCPHLKSDGCACRKPATGMARQAQQDYPSLDFAKAVIVGDSVSDMEFGRALGIKTVFIPSVAEPPAWVDACFIDLLAFARALPVVQKQGAFNV